VRNGVECDSYYVKVLFSFVVELKEIEGSLSRPTPLWILVFWTCIASPARIFICMQHSRPNKESITVV
jgi:hypothetical protein